MKHKDFATARWGKSWDEAENPAASVEGDLAFNGEDGSMINVKFGTLIDGEAIDGVRYHTPEALTCDFVYGVSQDNRYYVLGNVVENSTSMSLGGYGRQMLRGQSLCVARDPITSNPAVRVLRARVEGLREWVGRGLYIKSNIKDGRRVSSEIQYLGPDQQELILWEDDEAKISIRNGERIQRSSRCYDISYEMTCRLEIVLKGDGLPVDTAVRQWLFPVWDFLTFCMGFRGDLDDLSFLTDESDYEVELYYPVIDGEQNPSDRKLHSMPLRYADIGSKVPSLLNAWLTFDGYAEQAALRVVELTGNWRMQGYLLFLSAAFAFEAASRVDASPDEFSDEELQRRLGVIKESEIEGKTQDWAIYKLRYANKRDASSLADELFDRLEPFSSYVIPDKKRFLSDHRTARNAYTHMRESIAEDVLKGRDLDIHTRGVRALVYGAVMLELGLDPETVFERFEDSRYLEFDIFQARKMYAIG